MSPSALGRPALLPAVTVDPVTGRAPVPASASPLADEAAWAERLARFLRHSRGGRTKAGPQPLTWEDAERALFEHAITARALAAKVSR